MSSHAQRGMPRGSLASNRYAECAPKEARTRREYRDALHATGGFAPPRLKSRRKFRAAQ